MSRFHNLSGAVVPALVMILALGVPALGQADDRESARLAAEAEAFWIRRDEPASMRNALDAYERIAALSPEEAQSHSDLARAFWWYALLRPSSEMAARRELYRRGAGAARRAQMLAPDEPGGYYWEAANLVEAATVAGGFAAPDDVLRIRKLIRKVEALNTWYQHGSIRYVEATLIIRLPTIERWLFGRRLGSAVDLSAAALGFENNCFYGHWVLARALLANGRRSAAVAQLRFILKGNPEAFLPDAPENRVVRKWTLKFLEELEISG